MNNVLEYVMLRQKLNKTPNRRFIRKRKLSRAVNNIAYEIGKEDFVDLTKEFLSLLVSLNETSDVAEYTKGIEFDKSFLKIFFNDGDGTVIVYSPNMNEFSVESEVMIFSIDYSQTPILNRKVADVWMKCMNRCRSIYMGNIITIADELLY
jgi:hypothetical protein